MRNYVARRLLVDDAAVPADGRPARRRSASPTTSRTRPIHTIVTKPVERFEIVLGRFLGYARADDARPGRRWRRVSLLYVVRGVTEEAESESLKARVPVYGDLLVRRHDARTTGDERRPRVGLPQLHRRAARREPNAPQQYAIWTFDDLPGDARRRRASRSAFEFTFDIFRLDQGRGEQGRLLHVHVRRRARCRSSRRRSLRRRQARARPARCERPASARREHAGDAKRDAGRRDRRELLAKYGVYEVPASRSTDYHTQRIDVPAGACSRTLREQPRAAAAATSPHAAACCRSLVSVDRTSAAADARRRPPRPVPAGRRERPFCAQLPQGHRRPVVQLTCWCSAWPSRCSTYLSGVISLLCTMFLFVAGLFVDYIQAAGREPRRRRRPARGARPHGHAQRRSAAPLDDSPDRQPLVTGVDDVYRWWLRRFLQPHPRRQPLRPAPVRRQRLRHLAGRRCCSLDNFLPLVGYLLPWAVLAFYLMKYREIANPT